MRLNLSLYLCLFMCWNVASALISYEKVSYEQRKPPRQEGFVTCVCGFTLVTRKLPIKELEDKFKSLKRHHTCMKDFRQDVCELPNICQFCIFKMTICCRDTETGIYKCSHGHISIKNDDASGMNISGRCKGCSDTHPRAQDRFGPPMGGMGMSAGVMSQDGVDWLQIANNQRGPVQDYGLYLPVLHLTAGVGRQQQQGDEAVWDEDELVDEDFKDRSRVETEAAVEEKEEEGSTEGEEEETTEGGEQTTEGETGGSEETTEGGDETTEGDGGDADSDSESYSDSGSDSDSNSGSDSDADAGAGAGANANASAGAGSKSKSASGSGDRRKREEVNFAGQWWKAVKSVFGIGKSIETSSKKIQCIVPVLNTADVKCKEKGKSVKCKRTCKKGFTGEQGKTLDFYCDKSVNKWNPETFGECFNGMPNKVGRWMNQSLARWFP